MNPQTRGRKGHSTETATENTFGESLLERGLGIWNVHIQNSHGPAGLPDRYLGGGLWIEMKAFVFTRKPSSAGRPKQMATLLRKSQKRTIPKLIAAGDKVFVCCFVHTEGEATRFIVVPYDRFVHMTAHEMDEQAIPWSATAPRSLEYVRNVIGR